MAKNLPLFPVSQSFAAAQKWRLLGQTDRLYRLYRLYRQKAIISADADSNKSQILIFVETISSSFTANSTIVKIPY
jgi:hypothetical protein